jgi:NADH-quinone oxidoreductase subunit M
MVVSVASTGLICVVRALEVRVSDALNPIGHLGLAVKAPRLATFFLISGLALIGLPGTLGYCAEDLLFHGALANHSWLGIALPLATAFNAINLFRLFGVLFLGVLPKHVIDIPDALLRERLPLTIFILFLLVGGLLPGRIIPWRIDAAETIQKALSGGSAGH